MHDPCRFLRRGLAPLVSLALAGHAAAATWTGLGGDSNWMTPGNWAGGVAPVPPEALVFSGSTQPTNNNNFAVGTRFDGITFTVGSGPFVLTGNSIQLGGNIANAANTNQTITAGLELLQDCTLTLTGGEFSRLLFRGSITGVFGLKCSASNGRADVELYETNTYGGGTYGTNVSIRAKQPASLPGAVTIDNGATLFLQPGAVKQYGNAISIKGVGVNETVSGSSGQVGALVLNYSAEVTGTVTLTGNSRITAFEGSSGNGSSGTVSGPIVGNYALDLGNGAQRPGSVTVSNPGNNWTGGTRVYGGASGSSSRQFNLTLSASGVLPSGAGRGDVAVTGGTLVTVAMGTTTQSVNALVSTMAVTENKITGSGKLTVGSADASGEYRPGLQTGDLVKTGSGTQQLGQTAVTRTVTVENGTLQINGTLTGSGGVSIPNGATFAYFGGGAVSRPVTLGGGVFAHSSTNALGYTGALTFTAGGIGGTNWLGSLSGLTLDTGRWIAPGNGVGLASVGSQFWANGGAYEFEITNAVGAAGTAWDCVAVSGELGLGGLTNAGGFTVRVIAPSVANFDAGTAYQWPLATCGSLTGTFGTSLFTVDASAFAPETKGGFKVIQDGTTLLLEYNPSRGTMILVR